MIEDSELRSDDLPEALHEFVYRRLVDRICSGGLAAGEKLSPSRLASDYGVSHIPVREALAALEAEGYVRRVPRVGFFVAELSSKHTEDVYHWRQILEDEAHRIGVPLLTDEDLARMCEINKGINDGADSRFNRFLDLNRAFHFVAFERAGSEILLRFLNYLWDAAARYQNTMDYARPSRAILREHHDALFEAFQARDINLVNARMAEHRALTLQTIRKMASSGDVVAEQ